MINGNIDIEWTYLNSVLIRICGTRVLANTNSNNNHTLGNIFKYKQRVNKTKKKRLNSTTCCTPLISISIYIHTHTYFFSYIYIQIF